MRKWPLRVDIKYAGLGCLGVGFGCSGFIGLGGSFLCIPHGLLVRLGGNYRHPFGVSRVRSLVRRVVSFAFLSQIGLKERALLLLC